MKTTGKEWKEFLHSWPKDAWYDDCDEMIDGTPLGDTGLDWDQIPDAAKVEVTCGSYFPDRESEGEDITKAFRKWKKTQTHATYVIEIPKTVDLHEFDKKVREMFGAKVIK